MLLILKMLFMTIQPMDVHLGAMILVLEMNQTQVQLIMHMLIINTTKFQLINMGSQCC